jgi:hypothetical protein
VIITFGSLISTLRGVGYSTDINFRKEISWGQHWFPGLLDVNSERKRRKPARSLQKQKTGRLLWCLDCLKLLPRGKSRLLSKFRKGIPGGKDWHPGCEKLNSERG